MDFETIASAFEDAGFDVRSYSGRGMYGQECLGVECADPVECVLQVIGSAVESASNSEEIADLVEALRDSRRDSLGLNSILYWPRIQWGRDNG